MKTYILLIDSNTDFRERTTAILRDKGFAVFESSTLAEAKAVLGREPINLMCVDAYVAGKCGMSFIKSIDRKKYRCQIAFICHPGRLMETQSQIAECAPVDILLHRPISPEELVYKLDTYIKLKALEERPTRESNPPVDWDDPVIDPSAKATLQEKYGEKIPNLFAEIGMLLTEASIDDAKSSLADLEEARRIAHMINGTAGSIGFTEVSAAAHSLETRLKETIRMRRLTSVPALHPVEVVEEPAESPLPAKGVTATMARVLVLDDDEDFLTTVELMGRENLIQVYQAKTSEEALAIARSRQLDAAIIDIILQRGDDAFKFAQDLRSIRKYTQLPLGFISVDASISKRVAAVHSGAALFLKKPLDSETFAAAVRRLVPMTEEIKPKILVVDDDEDFLAHVTMVLAEEGIETATLTDATNIVEEIDLIEPDMVLLDVVMKKINGLDACRVLRSVERWQEIPILVLTVHGNRETLLGCFNAGADDYIEKPIIKEELMARINLRLERIKLFRERADIDSLTGLPTRRPFVELLKMRISESARFNKPVALCLMDLDNFKEVNDCYGHLAGDRVLTNVGRLLKSRFRTMDVRGRWGGEEFVVAFYGEEEDTAKMIVNRVLEEMREMTFTGDHGETFHVTFSAGVASYPTAGQTVEELFRRVDKNLYRAKNNGRNRIEIG
jgi:diguanylate cyclase (GGDEF)-like protein